jgi:hypothetical protein
MVQHTEASIFLTTVCVIVSLLLAPPIVGSDAYHHLTNLSHYIHGIEHGVFPLRWADNNFFGFGAPMFYYYPPLVSIVGALLHFVLPFLSLDGVLHVLTALVIISSGVTMWYYLGSLQVARDSRFWAALLYAVSPYAMFDVFFRSAYGEYLSMIWIPIIFCGIEKLLSQKSRREAIAAILITAIGWALLVLSNIPEAVIIFVASAVYVLLRTSITRVRLYILYAVSLILAAGLIAFYILPVIQFRNFAHLSFVYGESGSDPFGTFWISSLLHGTRNVITGIEIFFFPLCCAVTVYCWRLWRASSSRLFLALFSCAIFVIGLHLPIISKPLTDFVPGLGLVQTPSRAYLLLMFVISVAVAVHKDWLAQALPILCTVFSISIVIYCVCSSWDLPGYRAEGKNPWTVFEYAPVYTNDSVGRFYDFIKTNANVPEIGASREIANSESLRASRTDVNRTQCDVRLSQPTLVTFHRFYWPQWQLRTSNKENIPLSADPNGVLRGIFPPGNYRTELSITKSNSELLGGLISIVCTALCAMGVFFWWGSGPSRQSNAAAILREDPVFHD